MTSHRSEHTRRGGGQPEADLDEQLDKIAPKVLEEIERMGVAVHGAIAAGLDPQEFNRLRRRSPKFDRYCRAAANRGKRRLQDERRQQRTREFFGWKEPGALYQKAQAVLAAVRRGADWRQAAAMAGVTERTLNRWRQERPGFDEACLDAALDSLPE